MSQGTVWGCESKACAYRWAPTTMRPSYIPVVCPLCRRFPWIENPPPPIPRTPPPAKEKKN